MKEEVVRIDRKGLPETCQNLTLEQIVSNPKSDIKRGPFGSSITKDMFVSSGYKIYEQKNAIQNNFEIGSYFIDEKKFEQMKDFDVKEDDIIMSCSGSIGKVAIVPKNVQRGIINQALLKITLDKKRMLPTYFKYLFESEFLQKKFVDNTMGGTIKNVASVKELKKIRFPVPSIIEQQIIVDKLSNQMAQIEKMKKETEEQRAILEALFESIINEEMQVLKSNLSDKCNLVKLEDVCDLRTGGTPSKSQPEYFGGDIKWVVSGDVNQEFIYDVDGRITEAGYKNSNAKMLPVDSVLIALNGQGKTRGMVAILKTEATCNQSVIAFTPKNKEEFYHAFLFYYLKGCYQKLRNLTGDKERSGLSMSTLRPFQVIMPPIAIQRKVAEKLQKKYDEIKDININLHRLEKSIDELPASIMNEVFGQFQIK